MVDEERQSRPSTTEHRRNAEDAGLAFQLGCIGAVTLQSRRDRSEATDQSDTARTGSVAS